MRRPIMVLVGMVLAVSTVACSDDASDGERAVCDQLQAIVALLEQDNRTDALASFYSLQELTTQSGNETMSTEGQAFFEFISEPVEGYENMTVEQTTQFADAALAKSSQHLDAIVDECDAVGLTIEVNDPASLAPDRS